MNEQRVREIFREELISILGDYTNIPLEVVNAFTERGFLSTANLSSGLLYISSGKINSLSGTGVVKLISSAPAVVPGGSKGVYVALISGGSPTNFMQVADGIVTAI